MCTLHYVGCTVIILYCMYSLHWPKKCTLYCQMHILYALSDLTTVICVLYVLNCYMRHCKLVLRLKTMQLSTTMLSHFRRKTWQQTLQLQAPPFCQQKNVDTWLVTCDTGHVTHDMWHVTKGGGWTLSNGVRKRYFNFFNISLHWFITTSFLLPNKINSFIIKSLMNFF